MPTVQTLVTASSSSSTSSVPTAPSSTRRSSCATGNIFTVLFYTWKWNAVFSLRDNAVVAGGLTWTAPSRRISTSSTSRWRRRTRRGRRRGEYIYTYLHKTKEMISGFAPSQLWTRLLANFRFIVATPTGAGGSTSNLRQALIWTDGHTDHNGTNITQRYLKAITKFTSNTT